MLDLEQEIRVIIPVAKGQITDLAMRHIAGPVSAILGRAVVLSNDERDGGEQACLAVASAPSDGRTLLLATTGTHVAMPALRQGALSYDSSRDFTPIALIGCSPWILVVASSSPRRSLASFIEWLGSACSQAGYFSASGMGCLAELALRTRGRIEVSKYASGRDAIEALQNGVIDFTFLDMVTAKKALASGECHALAVSSAGPTSLWPVLPALGSVVEGFELSSWAMLAGPAGLAPNLVDQLNRIVVAVVFDRDVQQALADIGFEPRDWAAARLGAFVGSEARVWKRRLASTVVAGAPGTITPSR